MNQKSKVIKIAFTILTLCIVAYAFYFYKSVISYLIFALLFTFIFNPFVTLIENLGIKRVLAVGIFYIIFFLNLFLLGSIFIPIIIRQINSFSQTYLNFVSQTNLSLEQIPQLQNINAGWEELKALFPFIDFDNLKNMAIDRSISVIEKIPNIILAYSSNVFKIVTYLITVPIISFFLLKDHVLIKNKLYAMIPNKYFEITLIIVEKINSTMGNYIRALLTEMAIVISMHCIVLTAMGIRFSILLGFIAGIMNVIPYVGPVFAVALAALTIIFTGGPVKLLFFTVFAMWCVQTIDNGFIYPLVMGKTTNIHPVIILFTVLAGGLSFGLLGMLVAVPTVFLVSTMLKVLYKNLKQFEII
jgi:predicted PurR-regulated permease PerM